MNTTSPTFFPTTIIPHPKPIFLARIWVLIEVLLILSYTVKPSSYRPLLFFVPIAILVIYSLFFTHMINLEHVANSGWGMACRLSAILLFASTNILLCDVQRELKPAKYVKKDGQYKKDDDKEEEPRRNIYDEPFLTRLKWGFSLWFNPRVVNFSDEATAVLPPRPVFATRRAFFLSKLRSLLAIIILYDAVSIFARANPYFGITEPQVEGYQRLWRLGEIVFGIGIYFMVKFQHDVAAIFSVGLGLTRPEDWPDLFNSFRYAYTLRGLWGKTWHQMFRRAGILHANFFLKKLGIPPKSTFASLFTLYTVFALSGILHHSGDAMFLQSIRKPGSFQFFMLQAVGITLEDAFLKLVRFAANGSESKTKSQTIKENGHTKTKKLPSWPVRLLGFAWVLVWLSLTLPLWTDPICRNGYMREIPQYSIILGLWKGDWAPEGWQKVRQ